MLKSDLPALMRAGCSGCFLWDFQYLQQQTPNLSEQPDQYFTTLTMKSNFSSTFLEFPVLILPEGSKKANTIL